MEFLQKLGVRYYTFHDRDLAPELGSMKESQKAFAHMVDRAAEAQARTGKQLLWGTANLFSHPRYMAGAATNPDPEVVACAATQVRDALNQHGFRGRYQLLNQDIQSWVDHPESNGWICKGYSPDAV